MVDDECLPFIKWAGGKRRLTQRIRQLIPARFGRYYEPFMGSAALFFAMAPKRATLGDANERLVRCFRGVRDRPERVIKLLRQFTYDRDFFLEQRARKIDRCGDAAVAAWFIYLNKTCFNGLYRVNLNGQFNVPFGAFKRPPMICNPDAIRACSKRLRGVSLRCADFEMVASRARRGDVVYFDPPYLPLTETASFTSYTPGGFGIEAHIRLRDCARRLGERGVHVVLSNSDHPDVRRLYADFDVCPVTVRRSISASTAGREPVGELLICYPRPTRHASAAKTKRSKVPAISSRPRSTP